MTMLSLLLMASLHSNQVSPLDRLIQAVENADFDALHLVQPEIVRNEAYMAKAESYLLTQLKSTNAGTRMVAASGLGMIRAQPNRAVPALSTALCDEDSRVRAAAARSLSSFGSRASFAMPRLMMLLNDDDDYLVQWVAYAIGECGSDGRNASDLMVAAMNKSNNPYTRAVIASSVLRVDASKKEALVECLLGIVNGDQWVSKALAADTLGEMKINSPEGH